jgi:surface carbohydrate biosynthesis protein (TIGR04326 family)
VNDLPLPDQVALNGVAAMDAYQKGAYPIEDTVEVEALRYLYLENARAEPTPVSPPLNSSLRVLVLGDYLLSNTLLQMRLLEKSAQCLPVGFIIMIKPHPNCPVQPADYPGLRMEMTMEPVSKLLAECDVAYTSSLTTAAVDAYCAGVPVVSVSDPDTLNLSPLRGREGVFFVSTAAELASALVSAASVPRILAERQDFFTLDPKLPRWRKLLLEVSSV